MKLLYVSLLLFIFCLDEVATTWCHKPYLRSLMRLKSGSASNGSSLSTEAEAINNEMIDHVSSFWCVVHSYIISTMLSLFSNLYIWNENQLNKHLHTKTCKILLITKMHEKPNEFCNPRSTNKIYYFSQSLMLDLKPLLPMKKIW